MEQVILKNGRRETRLFHTFPQLFSFSWMVPTFFSRVWAHVQEGGEGSGRSPQTGLSSTLDLCPKEGDDWVATLGLTGSDQFLSVPLCSWAASRGGPGTEKHLP